MFNIIKVSGYFIKFEFYIISKHWSYNDLLTLIEYVNLNGNIMAL